MEDIVIDNFHIGYWDGFGYLEEAVLCIDRLINSPCSQLMKKYNLNSKMEYFHFILPHIARLFSIDRKKLTKEWVDVFGYQECFIEILEKRYKEKMSNE